MNFEDIVYRCPGAHSLPGGSYDYRGVNSEEAFEKALSEGWFNTIGEAIEGKHLPKADPRDDGGEDDGISGETGEDITEPSDKTSAPTREEMEVKAKELGVKFDGRTTDVKLLERINEALAK